MKIVWDQAKNKSNLKKHKLSFEEAKQIFRPNNDFLQIYDGKHSINEDRFIAIGPIIRGIIVVITTEPGDNLIRIISARFATKKEIELYKRYLLR